MKRAGYQTDTGGEARSIAVLTAVSVVLAACLLPSPAAHAAEITASGTDWTLDGDGLLTVSSDAGMADWISNGVDTNKENITHAVISDGVTYIENAAFLGCSGLTEVTMSGMAPPALGAGAFADSRFAADSGQGIHVPEGAVLSYKTAWSESGYTPCIFDHVYTVTYNADGGTIPDEGAYTGYTEGEGLTLPIPEKPGYIFDGWYETADLSGTAAEALTPADYGDRTYYAKWTANACTVTYHKDGGAIADEDSYTTYTEGVGLPELPTPEKRGYTFEGWYETADYAGSRVTGISSDEKGDRIYYAKWTANVYTVTYNADGGTIPDEGSYTRYTVGAGLPELPTPTKRGYTFDGWYENADYTGSSVTDIAVADYGDKTYYAKWVANTYTVTYNTDGGTITDEGAYTGYTEGVGLWLPIPEKPGYTFAGWYEDYGFTGSAVMGISAADYGNKTYYAKWTANAYAVTYNADGGTIPDESAYADYTWGEGLRLPIPTKPGYVFEGWYETADYAGSQVTDISALETGNKTYYAKWTAVKGINPKAADYADTDMEVRAHTVNSVVYSVDVEWGAMTFQYENSTWDATTHQSVAGGGWKVYDSEKDEALNSTEDPINRIQVTNHSNDSVRAVLSYAGLTGYEDITGSFTKAQGDTDTVYKPMSRTLFLDTADNGTGGAAGNPTVGTVYFMPSGIKAELKNGITRWTRLGTITVGIKPGEESGESEP